MLRHHWSDDRKGVRPVNMPTILVPKSSLPEQMEEKWEWKPVNRGLPGNHRGGDGGSGDVVLIFLVLSAESRDVTPFVPTRQRHYPHCPVTI